MPTYTEALNYLLYANVGGAGAFGVTHLLIPVPAVSGLVALFPGAAAGTPYAFSDMFIASTFLGFAITSALALASNDPTEYWPVIKMQQVYKTIWCVAFLVGFAGPIVGRTVELNPWTALYFAIMASYALADTYVLSLKPKPKK